MVTMVNGAVDRAIAGVESDHGKAITMRLAIPSLGPSLIIILNPTLVIKKPIAQPPEFDKIFSMDMVSPRWCRCRGFEYGPADERT